MRRVEPDYHRVLGLGIILLVAALLLFVYMVDSAQAGPLTPPTAAQGQRIVGAAFDARLRRIYPRSGITTRCRGNRHYLLCSVHVWRRGSHLFWQITEVRLRSGAARTSLSPALDGLVAIPHKAIAYRSRPVSP